MCHLQFYYSGEFAGQVSNSRALRRLLGVKRRRPQLLNRPRRIHRVGTPVAPRNFNRALDMLIKKAGVRRITPHVSRHMEATFNKDIGTPLKDTQQILGHAHSDTTQKIYQHGSSDIQRQALTAIDELLHKKEGGCSQILLSHQISTLKNKPVSGLAALLRSGESGETRI